MGYVAARHTSANTHLDGHSGPEFHMRSNKTLTGRRIAVLAADGFEKVELTVPVAALRAAGAKVDIVSLRHGRIRGVNLHEPASRVRVTRTIGETSPDHYDALLIPGGFINPDLLRQSREARTFVREFDKANKPIATICHGPWLLASADLVRGRTMTSWPGVRDDMVNAGATWLDEPVVTDRNWVTSRGPQDMAQFVPAILHLFGQSQVSYAEAQTNLSSSPQRNAPPEAMLTAMKWIPRPSLRTAIVIAAVIGGGVMWANSRRRQMGLGKIDLTELALGTVGLGALASQRSLLDRLRSGTRRNRLDLRRTGTNRGQFDITRSRTAPRQLNIGPTRRRELDLPLFATRHGEIDVIDLG
jgi:protease I